MAVLLPGKFLYLCVPHTASISTTEALATVPGTMPSDIREIVPIAAQERLPAKTHHVTKENLLKTHAHLFKGTEVVFAVRRNPYDLIVTWWLRQRHAVAKRTGHEPTFREFVETYDDRGPGPYLRKGRMFWMDADRWLRYEALQEDLNGLLRSFGLEPVELPRKNPTLDKAPWREYYDARLLEVVWDRFGAEIEGHGYERVSG